MNEKMLKFTSLNQANPEKREKKKEKKILMKFIMNLLNLKLENNQADALNVEFLFVKFIVL
jgi:hypothetical protein